VATAQAQVMQRTLGLQLHEAKLAAEPIFVWGNGSANDDMIEWEFMNEGGPISHLTITIQSPTGAPTGIHAAINPTEWLGTSRRGGVAFRGNTPQADSIYSRLSDSHRRCRRFLFPHFVARCQTDAYRQRRDVKVYCLD
jgi:hypothetical protein